MNRFIAFALSALLVSATHAHDALTLDDFAAMLGWNFDEMEITTEPVADGLFVLFGAGGNIAASVGDDGVLVVDDQFPQMMPKIKAAIAELGGEGVDYAINTHWHFDHADGNLTLGPEGTRIVSHANSRAMMLDDHMINMGGLRYAQRAYPTDALPDITYDSTMQLHFNGERIDLLHAGPAHTTGDTAVIFRGSNAVHFGDVFNNAGYPFIDADNGGDLTGMIAFCRTVLAAIDEETIVIPGHGPVTDVADLRAYIAMLEAVRFRVGALVLEGKPFGAVMAAKPTAAYDARYGDPTAFINRVYASLKRELNP